MTERIKKELAKRLEAAKFESITITMKVNGDRITITPCSYLNTITSFDDIEYYLMDSCELNLCGGEKLDDIARTLARYDELLEEDAKALNDLKAHIRKYGERADWDFVSDYHKDIFGHRPHVPHSQIIAWANSDSTGSARYFR